MYAVIKTGGKQYRVAPGDTIRVDHLSTDVGGTVTIDQVLAVSNGDTSLIGEPLVQGATVSATVIDQGREKKIRVFKMRRRKHYRKTQGHRQDFTEIFVSKIESSLGADSADAAAALARASARRERVAATTAGGEARAQAEAAAIEAWRAKTGGAPVASDDTATTADEPEQVAAADDVQPTAAPAADADDLTKVEGIGPKISELLQAEGISTFAALAATDAARIAEILKAAGGTFAARDPATWPAQAQMAADGKWDELKKWQDELDGGRA